MCFIDTTTYMASTELQGMRTVYQEEPVTSGFLTDKTGCYHHLLQFHGVPLLPGSLERLDWFYIFPNKIIFTKEFCVF